MDAAGGSGSTSLSTGSTCSWSASSSASWLTVSPSSGSAAGTISYTVVANTGVARSANLSIGGVTFVVSQGAAALSTAPVATLTPTTLSFGGQPTGQSSAAKTATLTNSGSGTLSITTLTQSGAASGDYTEGGSCAVGSALAAGQSCTVAYTFAPSALGNRSATLSIGTTANAVTLNLSGSGKKPGRK